MFEIGFSEILMVALVTLLVFGPDRLPGAARTAGLWIGRMRRYASHIKSEVEREVGADQIRWQLHNERIMEMERELRQSGASIQSALTPQPAAPVAAAEVPAAVVAAEAAPGVAATAEAAPAATAEAVSVTPAASPTPTPSTEPPRPT